MCAGTFAVYPDLAARRMEVDVGYINGCVGVDLAAGQIADLLSRMALFATPSPDGASVAVEVPPTRSDVLHACDVMEARNAPRSLPTCSACMQLATPSVLGLAGCWQ